MLKVLKQTYSGFPAWAQNVGLTAYSLWLHRERYGGDYSTLKDLLAKTEWYRPEQLEEYQNVQLRRIVGHAYETVPYYRRIFDERGLRPGDISNATDLVKLPVLTKELIKQNFHSLLSTVYRWNALKYGHTSGTTGTPLEIAYSPSLMSMTYAALDRQYRWAGAQLSVFGDRVAIIRGNVIVPIERRKPPFWRHNYLHNQLFLSSFHLAPENLGFYIKELKRFRPRILDGYPSTLYVLAKFLKNSGEQLPLHAVLSSSETLFDFQRSTIEESFSCRVFDYYGAAERVVFATECDRHEGHHLNSEFGITEVLGHDHQPVGLGHEGMLVGTSLHNYGMPLIRYVTNDVTALKTQGCSCGRSMPLMEDIATKAEDILTLSDGRLISPSVLTHPFKPMHSVQASQIIQESHDTIRIKIVPGADYSSEDTEYLIREFKGRLGARVNIEVDMVNELPRSPSGKFKWVISKVNLGI